MQRLTLALCLSSAAAYVSPVAPKASVSRAAGGTLADLEGDQVPLGKWDPLNLADTGEFGPTLEWYRAAELKHGRVAMAAFVGFIVTANGITWPGNIAPGVSFKSLVGATPLDTWDNLPMYGKYQIIAWVGLMEICTEMQQPHYLTPGGKLGEVMFDPVAEKYSLWDPLKTMKSWDDAKRARGRLVELQNGRAAMAGVIGFVMAYKYDGTVPALNFLPDYTGELPAAPFAANWHISETASAWAW